MRLILRDAAHQLLPAGRGRRAAQAVSVVQDRSGARCPTCRCRARPTRSSSTAPRIEGVHLRGGKVARGGIRWSDRREDFRTEVLGLMKAQMVKNGVIVPVGAKGGFVVKRPPRGGDRAALQAEVVACYQTLMRGMLDLTDNRVGERHRAAGARGPLRRRRSLSGGRGRQGHRHLLRHRQRDQPGVRPLARRRLRLGRLGRLRPQGHGHHRARRLGVGQAPFPRARQGLPDASRSRAIGIGDMSGDVFGNGMLLSRADPADRGLRPPPHLHRPGPRSGAQLSPSASGCSSCRARAGTTTTAASSAPAAASIRAPSSRSGCRRRRAARSTSRPRSSRRTS